MSEYLAVGPYYYDESYYYMDDMGHFWALFFDWEDLAEWEDEDFAETYAIGTGEVGLVKDRFTEDISGYDLTITQYYTLSTHDAPGVSIDEDSQTASKVYLYSDYAEAEAEALQERYGSSEYDSAEGYIEGFISTLSADVTTTATVTEYTFKKIIQDVLDYDNLSSFAQEEEEQAVSATTSFVSGSY